MSKVKCRVDFGFSAQELLGFFVFVRGPFKVLGLSGSVVCSETGCS